MSAKPHKQKPPYRVAKTKHKKLQRLPSNAHIEKRPLLRPAFPSPHSGSQEQKVVYISAKTPFLSAVKRVEKLLHLSEKRLVQSATTLPKQIKGKRKRGAREEDEILDIAETVERQKKQKKGGIAGDEVNGGEEVVVKGTGKAIQKVMELGLWFQQREEYAVRLRTGSVAAIDDISVDEDASPGIIEYHKGQENKSTDDMDVDVEIGVDVEDGGATMADRSNTAEEQHSDKSIIGAAIMSSKSTTPKVVEPVPETRIRYLSCLEVAVSLH